jgi:hypothetical protein
MRPAKWRKKNPDVTSQIKCAGLAYFYINRLPTSRNVSQPSCVCVCTYSTLEFSTEQGCQIFLGAKIPKWGGGYMTRFFLAQKYQNRGKYTKWPYSISKFSTPRPFLIHQNWDFWYKVPIPSGNPGWETLDETFDESRAAYSIRKYVDTPKRSGGPDWEKIRPMDDCLHTWQFVKNYRRRPHCWATFFHGKGYALILTNKELGYILGDFVTNSSDHSVKRYHVYRFRLTLN